MSTDPFNQQNGNNQQNGKRKERQLVSTKRKKGARSYYPLFCTIAETLQVFDFLHRPGNVHDPNGAEGLILERIDAIRSALPNAHIMETLRTTLIQHAGKLTDPGGVLTLAISANTWIKNRLLALLGPVQTAP